MAAKSRRKSEKIAEIVGKRHTVLGAVLLFMGVFLAISMLGYAPGQETFFRNYLEPLYYSTELGGANVCGRFGATATLLLFVGIGVGAFMLPVYLIWFGILCMKRRAVAVGKLDIFAAVLGLLLLSAISAVIQAYVQAPGLPTPFFPLGAGGSFGTFVFDNLLFPVFDKSGSLMLLGTIYAVCLITVFVESPAEAAVELWNVLRKTPKFFGKAVLLAANAVIFPFKYALNKIVERRVRAMYNPDTIESDILRKPLNVGVSGQPERPVAAKPSRGPVSEAGADAARDMRVEEPEPRGSGIESSGGDIGVAEENNSAEEDPLTIDLSEVEVASEGRSLDFAEDDADFQAPFGTYSRFEDDDSVPDVEDDAEGGPQGTGEMEQDDSRLKDGLDLGSFEVVHTVEDSYSAKPQKSKGDYIFPSVDILRQSKRVGDGDKDDYEARIREIVDVIGQFGARVIPDKASPGPVVTRYEVRPAPGVRINRIAVLEDDIALGIRAKKVRVIAPIPGKGTVGIEVPNKIPEDVCMRDLIVSKEWNETSAEIPIALGKDVTGKPLVVDLAKMPHLLIAGTTGSGKSVCVNSIIVSMLYRMTPDDLRFIMVDPKVVELQGYNALPHMLIPVVTDIKKVPAALRWLVSEMERRYKIFKCTEVRNIAGFNAKILKDKQAQEQAEALDAALTPEERVAVSVQNEEIGDDTEVEIPKQKLPYIVCIVDEFADLMMTSGKEVEQAIARLTQLARAAGIHLIIATQRPSTNVITGLIKANLSTRIALRVQSQVDSRTILDHKGAETLIGRGDMLYYPGGDFIRAQGAYLTDEEIEAIVAAVRQNGEPEYVEEIQSQIDADSEDEDSDDEDSSDIDPKFGEAVRLIRSTKRVSTSFLQMKLGIGYGRAARIIDALEVQGKIGPDKGPGKPRDIYLD